MKHSKNSSLRSSQNKLRLQGIAAKTLEKAGLSFESLISETKQIVVFGSFAAGVERVRSDLDLFCLGAGTRFKSSHVDLVWLPYEARLTERWLGSELANHISTYGIWIHGEDDWSTMTFVSKRALDFKKRLITTRASRAEKRWRFLNEDYKQKHVVKLRRDIQRLVLMTDGKAVPPSPLLDAAWLKMSSTSAILQEAIASGCSISDSQIRLFSKYLPATSW